MAGENLTQAVTESPDLFVSTGHQIMEMGIVFSMLLCGIGIAAYIIRRQYLDGRADRSEYLTATKTSTDAMNNLARQQELANVQKVSCLYKGS